MVKSEFNDKARGRAVENIIAMLLDKNLPGSYKGSDFTQFEIKTIQVKYTKRDKLTRTCGDTPISEFNESDTNFETSNIWDKIKSVISVLVYEDIIVDVLYFDGELYKNQLESDYNALFIGENNHRRKDGKTWRSEEGKNNKYLARKDYKNYTSSVMVMGNNMIDLSKSISSSTNLTIDDQIGYLEFILGGKISNYKIKLKSSALSILDRLNMTSDIKELVQYRDLINRKLDLIYSESKISTVKIID
jgi:hypothetical protein